MQTRVFNYIDLLPKEILTEHILIRLPVKYLGQCKCVSKPWNSLISDPYFVKTHLITTRTCNDDSDNNPKIILIPKRYPGFDVCVLYSYSLDNNGMRIGSRLKFDCANRWSRVWGSCDGFVLAQNGTWTSMYLLNPKTLESKQLPVLPSLRSKDIKNGCMFGFGYDSGSDDYAVVAISYRRFSSSIKVARVYVYMLRKGYWDKVGLSPYDYTCCAPGGVGIFVGGCLHWLAKNVNDSSWLISAFSLATKEFSQVPLPYVLGSSRLRPSSLGVTKGCLCLINWVHLFRISEVWVMTDYGVVDSWVKFSMDIYKVYPPLPLHLQQRNLVEMDCGRSCVVVVTDEEEAKSDNCDKVIISQSRLEPGMTYVESLVSSKNEDAQQKEKRGRRSKAIK
ncbi:F-box domain-containing protein [Heracleum sosnowskyi]|uniref:F-box domain-containing protein n=1 Tax=Heracleum sosnowskyi TaxID=360622 RepID=A0AAD8MQE7_9APIA|nr:F-box domain-containing protein [Heracleum sosnowskyi]